MNRKECLKIMVRCVAFVVVFSMLFGNATDLLMRHDDESNEIHAFYSEPEDTIDVLYVGSSPLLRGVSPMVMWQEHGFTGYVRASALQAPSVSYGLLAESLKYQNPELVVLLCDNIFSDYDYIIDAIDMVSSKLLLAEKAYNSSVPIISSMGAGNKLNPTAFEVTDIYKTSVCPLAKVMRTELKKRKIKKLKVVYSKELPLKPEESEEKNENRRQIPGSVSFVPPVVGLIIAGEVIKDLTDIRGRGFGA